MKKQVVSLAVLGGIAVVTATAMLSSPRDSASAPQGQTQMIQGLKIEYARRFHVQQAFEHKWRRERPLVNGGWLLVVSAPVEKLQPRQTMEPVLYVGAQTADRVNIGDRSGKVVLIVPGQFRLESAPAFLGAPALPEELRQADIDGELARARQQGLLPAAAAALESKIVAEVLMVEDEFQLRLAAIDLVERFSPQEKDLISGWRVPLIGK